VTITDTSIADTIVHDSRAMGSALRLVVVGGDDSTVNDILERIGEIERLWSRFRDDSDIARLNGARTRTTDVAPETIRLIETMIEGHRATEGRFDPTLLVPIIEIGYGTSVDGRATAPIIDLDLARRGSLLGIEVDQNASTIRLPAGTVLDPGGVGKGLAGDLITEEFVGRRCLGLLVSLGGDVVVAGQAPEGRGWTISILDPTAHHEIDRVHLAHGSVATSSAEIRVFERGHHLVDPDTLEATRSGVRSASVVAGSGAWAEMLTKWLMVDGPRRLDDLDRLGIAANTVTHDGQTENDCWKRLAVGS